MKGDDVRGSSKKRRVRQAGITLIELAVVMAIIGILSTVAYPAYTESVAKGRRARATAQLVEAQQWMERFYGENMRYESTSGGGTNTQFGARYTTVPPPGEGVAVYNLSVAVTSAAFTLRATRTGPMAGDRCGDMTLDHLGRKSFAASTTSGFANEDAARAFCWK